MLNGVNIEEVKKYNESLKQYRDKAASLKAEIDYTNKTLDSMCEELSKELGMQITRDNIEQVYNTQVEKINSILQSGNAVLSKIRSEEQNLQTAQTANMAQTVQQPTQPQAPVSVQPQAPVGVQPQAPVSVQPQVNTQSQMGVSGTAQTPVFDGNESQLDGSVKSLPPLFSM